MSSHNFRTRKEQIEAKALTARREGQFVDIDWMLPSILIHRGAAEGLYYREHAALSLLEQYGGEAAMLGVTLKDLLLSCAQEW